MSNARWFLLALFVGGFASSQEGRADSFYANVVGFQQVTSDAPVTINGPVATTDIFSGQGSASAGPGTLGDASLATYNVTGGTIGGGSNFSQSNSEFVLSGIHITGPGSLMDSSHPIMASFNINVEGSIGATATTDFGAQAGVGITYALNSFFGGFGGDLGSMDVDSAGNVTRTGVFSTFSSTSADSVHGTTASIETFGGDTLSFEMQMQTTAVVFLGFQTGPGTANAFANFFHTAGFDPAQPVLILPDGYSAYSDDGSIVDNHFVTGTGTTSAPEPASLALLVTGLLGTQARKLLKQR